MDRSRGSSRGRPGFRGGSGYHYHQSSSHHHNEWSRSNGGSSKDYDHRYSVNGHKRKYDSSPHDLRKSLSHSSSHHDRKSYHDEGPRKHFRTDSNYHSGESRSYHRSDYEYDSSRNVTYREGPSHGRYGKDDDHSARRFGSRGSPHPHRGSSSHSNSRGRGHSRHTYAHRVRRESSLDASRSPAKDEDRDISSHQLGNSGSISTKAHENIKSVEKTATEEDRKPTREEKEESEPTDEVELTLTEEDLAADEQRSDHDENQTAEAGVDESAPSKRDASQERNKSKSGRCSTSPSGKRKSSGTTAAADLPDHFIRLQCPHCHQRAVTFREYISHLGSQRHADSLRKISLQHRMSLAKLRTRQRKEQKQIEAQSTSSRSSHPSRMNFCAICKLYHSESRPNHEATELHKIIKNFLMPYCPICRVHFKSRMLYEKHVATLTHIKNKVHMEKAYERRRNHESHRQRSEVEPKSGTNEQPDEDEIDLNLDNFMILDAVGSDVEGDLLEETPVGLQFVKPVEVLFCEVCQRYLNKTEPLDKAKEVHCRSRAHHLATEERKAQDNPDLDVDSIKVEPSDCVKEEEMELKRSESEEQLWEEAEKDIGDVEDSVQAAEEDHVEEENNNGEADVGEEDDVQEEEPSQPES